MDWGRLGRKFDYWLQSMAWIQFGDDNDGYGFNFSMHWHGSPLTYLFILLMLSLALHLFAHFLSSFDFTTNLSQPIDCTIYFGFVCLVFPFALYNSFVTKFYRCLSKWQNIFRKSVEGLCARKRKNCTLVNWLVIWCFSIGTDASVHRCPPTQYSLFCLSLQNQLLWFLRRKLFKRATEKKERETSDFKFLSSIHTVN